MRGIAALLLGAACALAWGGTTGGQALAERRKDAVERCEAQRGVDCRTEKGLRTWLLQERTRAEAIEDGSRSIRQRVDRREPEKQ